MSGQVSEFPQEAMFAELMHYRKTGISSLFPEKNACGKSAGEDITSYRSAETLRFAALHLTGTSVQGASFVSP